MTRFTLLTSAAAIALSGLATTAATAQDEDAPLSVTEAQTGDVITVTARRREESLIDTPVAVSAFGAEDINDLGIQTVDDIARFTPGLSFSAAFGRSTERPVIRGQSNVLAGVQFGVESGTAYFVDGIYFPATIQNLDPNDIERVEVIKGPQSALYGRNTYAGAINFVTRGATEDFEANSEIRLGSYGERDVSFRMAGPLGTSERLGYSLTVRDYSYDGEWTNTVTGQTVGSESTFSASGVLDMEFSSNFDVRARISYTEDDDGPLPIFLQPSESNNCMEGWRSNAAWPGSGSSNFNQYYCGTIAPAPVALNTGPVVTPRHVDGVPPAGVLYPGFRITIPVPFPPFQIPLFLGGPFDGPYSTRDGTAFDGIEREQLLASLQANWDIGGSGYLATLSVAARDEEEWQGFDSDHSAVNVFHPFLGDEAFFANTGISDVQDHSIELKLASPTRERLRWMIGGFYYDQEDTGYDITFASPGGVFDDVSTVTNTAIFGLVEYDLSPELTLTVEGRYAEEEKTFFDASLDAEASFDNFTPRVTLDWNPDANTTVYGVFAQGVKPGGLNGSIGASIGQPTYDQETSDNYEIGYKGRLFDGAALFTAAGYFIEATDVQLTTPVANTAGALTSIATNQGSAEIWGIELAWNHVLNRWFNYGLTYAWTDPTFTEGCDDFQWTLTSGGGEITPGSTAPGTGSAFFGQTGNCSIEGNRLPLTSEHQASANFELRQPLFDNGTWEWFVQSDLTYESSKFVQVHNLAETGSSTLLGARIGIENERMSLLLWGENLTDEDSIVMATRWLQIPYFTFASPNIAPSGASTGSPRAFFGTLRKGPAVGVEARLRF